MRSNVKPPEGAGIRWSFDQTSGGIPPEWLEALRGTDIVEEVLDKQGIG